MWTLPSSSRNKYNLERKFTSSTSREQRKKFSDANRCIKTLHDLFRQTFTFRFIRLAPIFHNFLKTTLCLNPARNCTSLCWKFENHWDLCADNLWLVYLKAYCKGEIGFENINFSGFYPEKLDERHQKEN